jgi:1-acyl-sn-glycerol-3-phosphate acyltransferase
MPLKPLSDPGEKFRRVTGTLVGSLVSIFLFSLLIFFNSLQTASLAIKPFSATAFRRFNRWAADTWWGLCVKVAARVYGVRIKVSGDEAPPRENAVVISNHQQMPDITVLMWFAKSKDRLGDLKWFVKDIVKYVPGIGWGMLFLDCPFVKRDWASDKDYIKKIFQRIIQGRIPLWLVTFAEGTRFSPDKLKQSQDFAKKNGLFVPRHVLIPRTKGFVATVSGMRQHLDAVYDVTIGYIGGVPTLWQWIKGYVREVNLHVRRYPVESLPSGEEELSTWLMERFKQKDELLEGYYAEGQWISVMPEKS